MPIIYKSVPLNSVERDKFLSDLFELEVSRGIEVKISATNENRDDLATFQVIVTTKEYDPFKTCEYLLHKTFKEGTMQQRGWHDKFTCVQK